MPNAKPSLIHGRRVEAASEMRLDPALVARANHIQPTPALFEISSLLLRLAEIVIIALTAMIFASIILENPSPELARAIFNAIFVVTIFMAIPF